MNKAGAMENGSRKEGLRQDWIWKLECNVDDCTGEQLGHVMELLLAAGARDVFYTPIYMKKNRPAWMVTVLCKEEEREALELLLFKETTTIGIRRQEMVRTILPRREVSVTLSYGTMQAKEVTLPDGTVRCYPEYDSAAGLAKDRHLPLWQVMADFYKAVPLH